MSKIRRDSKIVKHKIVIRIRRPYSVTFVRSRGGVLVEKWPPWIVIVAPWHLVIFFACNGDGWKMEDCCNGDGRKTEDYGWNWPRSHKINGFTIFSPQFRYNSWFYLRSDCWGLVRSQNYMILRSRSKSWEPCIKEFSREFLWDFRFPRAIGVGLFFGSLFPVLFTQNDSKRC